MKSQLVVMEPYTFFNYLDMEKWKNADGSYDVIINVQDIHKDESGEIPAGVYYTLLDVATGAAVSEAAKGFGVTIDLHVQTFQQTACEKLICTAYPIQTAENSGSGKGSIVDEEGNLLATGMATFKVVGALE
ncbi:PaaI family thioesterase [Planococcus salinus]|uniref:PaaI family thioesterase n=1 Tax=Planococcus salinus TaxID=1848460 RepID=A0A3M8P970_9BACL|nr:PaaI family thioesterase [Planococcus salinus]RNF40217.1 PaaI family thioesterase [Planococcus salinus]